MALASVGKVLQRQRNFGAETQHVCDMEVNHKDCVQNYFLIDTVLKYHKISKWGSVLMCLVCIHSNKIEYTLKFKNEIRVLFYQWFESF